jgi:hypothetical protein
MEAILDSFNQQALRTGKRPPYCLVSDDEWAVLMREFIDSARYYPPYPEHAMFYETYYLYGVPVRRYSAEFLS